MALTTNAINNAFNTVFGRSATASELQVYGNFESSAALTSQLYLEPEYMLNTMPVARLFHTLLGRDPEASAVNFYGDHLRDGSMDLVAIANAIMASPEAGANFGYASLSNEAFVQQMYQTALGREGEEQGVDYYVARLETGTLTRAGVAVSFATSAEVIARVGIREFPSLDQSGNALIVGVDDMQTFHGFASGINTVDLAFGGSALNYTEMNASGVTDLAGAVDLANGGLFNGNVRYVFLAGAENGYLIGDTNGDLQADTAITLTGVTSLDGFAATDIV